MKSITKHVNITHHKSGAKTVAITETAEHEFLLKWSSLGVIEKRIFKKIQWLSKNLGNVFPSQETIAKQVKCTRFHVNKTFKKFKEFGWITLVSRGLRRSKTILLSPQCYAVDVSDIKSFTLFQATSKATPITLNSREISLTSTAKQTGISDPEKQEAEREIPPKVHISPQEKARKLRADPEYQKKALINVADYLKRDYHFSYENNLKLSLVPEGIVRLAVESTNIKSKRKKLGSWENYAVETAIKIAENRGFKLNWWMYYNTLKQRGVRK